MKNTDELSGGNVQSLLLSAFYEVDQERRDCGRVRFEQQVTCVQDVRFHPGQVLHPGQRLGNIEECIVPPPQH